MDWMIAGIDTREAVRLIRAHWKTALLLAALIAAWELIWGPDATHNAGAWTQQDETTLMRQTWDAEDISRQHPACIRCRELKNDLENQLLTKQTHMEPLRDEGSR